MRKISIFSISCLLGVAISCYGVVTFHGADIVKPMQHVTQGSQTYIVGQGYTTVPNLTAISGQSVQNIVVPLQRSGVCPANMSLHVSLGLTNLSFKTPLVYYQYYLPTQDWHQHVGGDCSVRRACVQPLAVKLYNGDAMRAQISVSGLYDQYDNNTIPNAFGVATYCTPSDPVPIPVMFKVANGQTIHVDSCKMNVLNRCEYGELQRPINLPVSYTVYCQPNNIPTMPSSACVTKPERTPN